MGYYVRALCKSEKVPTLKEVFDCCATKNINLKVHSDYSKDVDLDSRNWEQFALEYERGKLPIIVEVNRDDGNEDCLFRREINAFIEIIGSPGLSLSKRKVLQHLKETNFTVADQLLSDVDDNGYDANWEFLRYFVEHCGGMIQADGEGFYESTKLIVKI